MVEGLQQVVEFKISSSRYALVKSYTNSDCIHIQKSPKTLDSKQRAWGWNNFSCLATKLITPPGIYFNSISNFYFSPSSSCTISPWTYNSSPCIHSLLPPPIVNADLNAKPCWECTDKEKSPGRVEENNKNKSNGNYGS